MIQPWRVAAQLRDSLPARPRRLDRGDLLAAVRWPDITHEHDCGCDRCTQKLETLSRIGDYRPLSGEA